MTTLLHVSDLHFGRHVLARQVEAIEEMIADARFDAVVVSGDLTQRARVGEFLRAKAFLRDAARAAEVLAVPGNHDVCWWFSPLHLGEPGRMYGPWRRWLSPELEPMVRLDDAVLVGLNTAQGISTRTLTTRLRDLSVIGDLRVEQVRRARERFATAPPTACRVVVMHHNPVAGEISRRHGLRHSEEALGWLADAGADLVLCGHDHQEAVHLVECTSRGVVVATAGTITNRSRGGRPASVNVVTIAPSTLTVTAWVWDGTAFVAGPSRTFPRHGHAAA